MFGEPDVVTVEVIVARCRCDPFQQGTDTGSTVAGSVDTAGIVVRSTAGTVVHSTAGIVGRSTVEIVGRSKVAALGRLVCSTVKVLC